MPYHIAANHVCHPNYAAYLINKQTLTMKDIEKIIQSIPDAYKVLYDRVLIEQLYTQYQSRKIDDSASVQTIIGWIRGKKLLLLAPGKSLLSKYEEIMAFIGQEKPFVISVNFLDPKYRMNACFVSNHKRMDVIGQELQRFPDIHTILTSNIPDTGREDCLYVDYDRYTNADEMISDNAGLMLLKLLAYCGAAEIYLAGFDGFHHKHNGNYYRRELNLKVNEEEILEKQIRIRKQLAELSKAIHIHFLTPSVYE